MLFGMSFPILILSALLSTVQVTVYYDNNLSIN